MTKPTLTDGVWPAMITPLEPDRSIDWYALDTLIEWYLEAGVAGLLVLGQSSEMFRMGMDERLKLGAHVVKRVAGRVPLIAPGTYGGSIEHQAETVKQVADLGVEAVVVLAACLCEPSDGADVWRTRLEALIEQTSSISLGLYECPEPYHRLIPADLLAWAARTERFLFIKETSCKQAQVAAKLDAVAGTPLKFYNADGTSLLYALERGASGYCGIAANFYPQLLVWLCANPRHELAGMVQQVLASLDGTIHRGYPISAKYVRQQSGQEMTLMSRVQAPYLTEQEQRALDAVMAQANQTLQMLPPVAAKTAESV